MAAKVLGFHYTTNEAGNRSTTLHLEEDFPVYYSNTEAGRNCSGKRVSTVYVGSYDCSAIKVGSEIEIYYDKAIQTKNGSFQPIKMIEVLSK